MGSAPSFRAIRVLFSAMIALSVLAGIIYVSWSALLVWALKFPAVQKEARRALRSGAPETVPAMVRKLRHGGDNGTFDQVLGVLDAIHRDGKLGPPWLAELSAADSTAVRVKAVEMLGLWLRWTGYRLRVSFCSADWVMPAESRSRLVHLDVGPKYPALCVVPERDAPRDWDIDEAEAAVVTLREAIIPTLIQASTDREPAVRRAAICQLGSLRRYDEKPILPTLIAVVRADPSPEVRQHAALGLRSASAVPVLVEVLTEDPDAVVRRNAIIPLWELRSEATSAVPALIEALKKDPDPSVNLCALDALGWIGSADGVPTLIVAARDGPSAAYRERALMALMHIGPKARDAVPFLIQAIKTESMATDALVRIGSFAVPALNRALKSSDRDVRQRAREALARIEQGEESQRGSPGKTPLTGS